MTQNYTFCLLEGYVNNIIIICKKEIYTVCLIFKLLFNSQTSEACSEKVAACDLLNADS